MKPIGLDGNDHGMDWMESITASIEWDHRPDELDRRIVLTEIDQIKLIESAESDESILDGIDCTKSIIRMRSMDGSIRRIESI